MSQCRLIRKMKGISMEQSSVGATVEPTQRAGAKGRLRSMSRWFLRTSHFSSPPLTRADLVYVTAIFLISRLLVLTLGVVGSLMFPAVAANQTFALHPIVNGGLDDWMRIYVHFDSGWYLGIAAHGYLLPHSGNPSWLAEWAFFPLYPLTMRPVIFVLGLFGVPGNRSEIAGVIVSHIALYVGMLYLYRLVKGELTGPGARRAVTYLVVFPASLFLSAVYPEGLFLCLSVMSYYYARKRNWAAAGALAAAAMLTRPQGLFLVIPLGIEFLAFRMTQPRPLGRRALRGLWLGVPVVAMGFYALYSHAETGYWLAYSTSSTLAWGHRLTPPPYPLIKFLLSPRLGGAFTYDFSAFNFAIAVIFCALVILAFRRLPPSYGVWLLLSLLFPLSTNGSHFFSLARYLCTAFPAFVALAAWSLGLRWTPEGVIQETTAAPRLDLRDRVIVLPAVLFLALFIIMFESGIYAAI